MEIKKYLGIDIGGTSIKSGIISSKGEIIITKEIPTNSKNGANAVIQNIVTLIKELLFETGLELKDIVGIGIGSPANIDSKNGVIRSAPNLGFKNIPIVSELKKIFNTKIKITNDADAAALGEAMFGSGKAYKSSVMITLGTGVGSGIIINNKIFNGAYSSGAEIGHMIISVNGRLCGCGMQGCLEAYCSAPALLKRAIALLPKHKKSILNSIKDLSVKNIFENYYEDEFAHELIEEYLDYLSLGIINVVNILQPESIIIGGGISKAGNFLIEKLNEKTTHGHRYFRCDTVPALKIEIATLRNDAGFIGAALLNK